MHVHTCTFIAPGYPGSFDFFFFFVPGEWSLGNEANEILHATRWVLVENYSDYYTCQVYVAIGWSRVRRH